MGDQLINLFRITPIVAEAPPVDPAVRWVESERDVTALAAVVVSARRSTPIVCLTTPGYLSRPLVSPETLADALVGLDYEIWVIAQRAHAWALTEALPPGLDVYGGAVRIWWPIPAGVEEDPRRHPRFTVFSASDVDRVVREITGELRRHQSPPPTVGDRSAGVVTKVFSSGAEILLDSGHRGFAANAYLADGPIYHAWEAVREGQRVDVEIRSSGPTSHGTIAVSLKPFAPDPWERLAAVYDVGMIVEGVAVDLKSFGAFIELLPGARGLLPNAHIASEYVSHPEDYLSPDDRVLVQLLTLEPEHRKAELALVDEGGEPEVQPVAALYPDGPSWLAPVDEFVADHPPPAATAATELDAASDSAIRDKATAVIEPVPETEVGGTEKRADDPAVPDEDDSATTATAPGDLTIDADNPASEPASPADHELSVQVDELAAATAVNGALEDRVEALVNQGDRELARLRQHAREIVGQLRDDIAAAERRIIELEQHDSAAVIADARRDIESVQQQTDELRERLAAAEQDREQLIRQVTNANRRAERSTRELDSARRDAQEAHAEASTLRGQLDVLDDGDPARRFVRELHYTWSRLYSSEADRRRYPFSEPIIGPAFLASLHAVHGITRDRVLEVCAHVVSGRAHEINSLELHQLRSSGGGDTPTVVRGDGALAWRVSLQVKTPSARRLHYWQRPDGRIELSKVVLHDDFSIV
jgi:predicted RNA-binding protein with RPS1 domain